MLREKEVTAVAKGKRTEKKCYDALIAEGYTQDKIKLKKKRKNEWVWIPISLLWKTIRHRFLDIDLFGLFDVVALHPEGKHIRFIQCKTNCKADKATREAIENLAMPVGCIKEIWVWFDWKGFTKWVIK